MPDKSRGHIYAFSLNRFPSEEQEHVVVGPSRREKELEKELEDMQRRLVETTINRAPTDESVKLLREMETAAEKEVVKAIHVGNTLFECVVHQTIDHMSDQHVWRAVFKLNGQQLTVEHSAYSYEAQVRDGGQMKMWTGLRDAVATVIASKMLASAFDGLRCGEKIT